ncbi:saccharopine dehydrogenase family protein [Murinocardiopsis flavida]|nr:saccharopine dehydrogenase C-terminal domain-containing protein [Murinocardiopsis flavida]
MGIAAADNLTEDVRDGRLRLLLADRDPDRAAHARTRYAELGGSVEVVHGTAEQEQVRRAVSRANVLATALTWKDAEPIIAYGLGRGVPVTGIGQPPGDPRQLLGESARGCRALLPVGLEPGLTEILATELLARLGDGTGLSVLCGGVPQQPRPPLGHSSWFGTRLTIDQRRAHAVRRGRIVEVERFTGTELVEVPGVGVLEASHDAMQTWPADGPLLSGVSDMTQKTLRWPGFAEKVRLLAAVGMLQESPVRVGGVHVVPRDVLDAVLAPRITPRARDRDVTVLVAEGVARHGPKPERRSLLVLARGGDRSAVSGMALLTGGALAESVRVLLRENPALPHGVLRAAEVFTGHLLRDLLGRLRRHGATIVETDGPAVHRIAPARTEGGPYRRSFATTDRGPDGP